MEPVQGTNSEEREQLITSHLPLVRHVLRQLPFSSRCGISDQEDLYSFGVIGLIQAVDHYDPSRGTSFATYAHTRIRGAILDGVRQNDQMSRTYRQGCSMIEELRARMTTAFGREPGREELLRASGLRPEKFDAIESAQNRLTVSLDGVPESEDRPFEVPDETLPDPAAAIERCELLDALAEAIRSLPERQQIILSLYYREGLRSKDIAAVLGVSASRISQLLAQTLQRLRADPRLSEAA